MRITEREGWREKGGKGGMGRRESERLGRGKVGKGGAGRVGGVWHFHSLDS